MMWLLFSLLTADDSALSKRIALLEPVASPAEIDNSSRVAIISELARTLTTSGYEVVRENDVTSLLLIEQKRQTMGTTDSGALARAAELLSARYVVSSQINRLQSDILFSAEMLDAKRGVVVNRVTKRSKSLDRLLLELPDVTKELLSDSATLVFTKQVEGARVWVDDRLVGTTPIAPLPMRAFGAHRVHVESDEHAPFDSEFSLQAGRTTRVRLELVSLDDLKQAQRTRRIVAISLLGGGALIGGLSSIGFVEAFSIKRQYDRADLLAVSQGQLDDMARRSNAFYAGSFVAVGVAAALVGLGVYLLIDDPYSKALSQSASVATAPLLLVPTLGGAAVVGGF